MNAAPVVNDEEMDASESPQPDYDLGGSLNGHINSKVIVLIFQYTEVGKLIINCF